jgi:hypothetical protein
MRSFRSFTLHQVIRMIKSRKTRWAGHVAHMRKKWNACRILVEKEAGKRPLGRPKT